MTFPRYTQVPSSEAERNVGAEVSLECNSAPPQYDAAPLPSYKDVQEMKREKNAATMSPTPAVSAADHARSLLARRLLGSDCDFFVAFLVSFFLNGLGFLCTILLVRTIAGRSGAISGFGLALVKIAAFIFHMIQLGVEKAADDEVFVVNTTLVSEDTVFVGENGTAVEVDVAYIATDEPMTTTAYNPLSDPANQHVNYMIMYTFAAVGVVLFFTGLASYTRAKALHRRATL